MNRRHFVSMSAIVAGAVATRGYDGGASEAGVGLLTITGEVESITRPERSSALDQLFLKHDVDFNRATVLDESVLASLPSIIIQPTLEYDGLRHKLEGPSLISVLERAGASLSSATMLTLRALDGYAVRLAARDAKAKGFIVARRLDDSPLSLGGLGPLWAVFDADRDPESAKLPLESRFIRCPWGLYHIDVSD